MKRSALSKPEPATVILEHAPSGFAGGAEGDASRRTFVGCGIACIFLTAGCLPNAPEPEDEDAAAVERSSIVYGSDDRREFFELTRSDLQSAILGSVVALLPNSLFDSEHGVVRLSAPTLGEAARLCPEEPFVSQPAAAFCSGVLVEPDLVLTAGHCVRVLALDKYSIAFGYYYEAPNTLTLDADSIYRPKHIVVEELSRADQEPRVDYAFIRLDRAATLPRRPIAVRRAPTALDLDERIFAVGASSGVPMKIHAAARITDPRAAAFDYFVAATDTNSGSSGGAAFNSNLELVGILARGGGDFFWTADGCRSTVQAFEPEASEHYTYAFRAVRGLCEVDASSPLCAPSCEEPCRIEAKATPAPGASCSFSHHDRTSGAIASWMLVLAAAARRALRKARLAFTTLD